MNDLTLDELNTLLAVFERAAVVEGEGADGALMARLRVSRDERAELESMDFDDCLGGACKL